VLTFSSALFFISVDFLFYQKHVFRWPGGTQVEQEQLVPRTALVKVVDLPHNNGEDYAEGIALFRPSTNDADSLLVVYDSVSKERQIGESTVTVDRVITLNAK
jgi:hypothetical protein